MYLRKLQLKDAPLMLAWMHDRKVTGHLRADFASKTLEDAERFIEESLAEGKNADACGDANARSLEDEGKERAQRDIHLAIASDEDEYMGMLCASSVLGISVKNRRLGKVVQQRIKRVRDDNKTKHLTRKQEFHILLVIRILQV